MFSSLPKLVALSALAVTLSFASSGASAGSRPNDVSSAVKTEAQANPKPTRLAAKKHITRTIAVSPERKCGK